MWAQDYVLESYALILPFTNIIIWMSLWAFFYHSRVNTLKLYNVGLTACFPNRGSSLPALGRLHLKVRCAFRDVIYILKIQFCWFKRELLLAILQRTTGCSLSKQTKTNRCDTLFSPLALEIGLCVICHHPMRPSPSWSLQTKQTESLKQVFFLHFNLG